MSFKRAKENFDKFYSEFMKEPERIIQAHKPELVELVKDQLYSGLNGRDKPLRPSYLNDPWFKTPEAGQWRNNPKGYANWKYIKTPPRSSSIGHPPRDKYTPNLTIEYVFYGSIEAKNKEGGVNIGSSIPMGRDIEKKYGSIIFGIGKTSKEYFFNYVFKPYWKRFIDKYKK